MATLSLVVTSSGNGPFPNVVWGEQPESPAAIPERDRSQRFFRDLAYGGVDPTACRCDVRLPQTDRLANSDGRHPVVVIVHGGAWTTGDKWTMAAWSLPLARRGFACVVINYRLAPKHPFPAQVDDVRASLAWIASVQDRFGFDLDRVALAGYSAGAHLATLTATSDNSDVRSFEVTSNQSHADYQSLSLPSIRAVVGGGTPTLFSNIPPRSELLAYWLGGTPKEKPDAYRFASPLEHFDGDDPPVLLVHGDADSLVAFKQAEAFLTASKKVGNPVRLVRNRNGGHMSTFVSETMKTEMISFLETQLSPKNPPHAPEKRDGK